MILIYSQGSEFFLWPMTDAFYRTGSSRSARCHKSVQVEVRYFSAACTVQLSVNNWIYLSQEILYTNKAVCAQWYPQLYCYMLAYFKSLVVHTV
jgi:hypothetical protein